MTKTTMLYTNPRMAAMTKHNDRKYFVVAPPLGQWSIAQGRGNAPQRHPCRVSPVFAKKALGRAWWRAAQEELRELANE